MARAATATTTDAATAPPAAEANPPRAFKARTVIGVLMTKLPDGSFHSREVGAVEAMRLGQAKPGPTLTFGEYTVTESDRVMFIGEPPDAMLADDRVFVNCPLGDPWPNSTQDRLSARAPEKALPRHDGGERVGPGYWHRKRALGLWPGEAREEKMRRAIFKIQHPGELAVAAARARGVSKPDDLERIRTEAVMAARTGNRGSGRESAIFAAAEAVVSSGASGADAARAAAQSLLAGSAAR